MEKQLYDKRERERGGGGRRGRDLDTSVHLISSFPQIIFRHKKTFCKRWIRLVRMINWIFCPHIIFSADWALAVKWSNQSEWLLLTVPQWGTVDAEIKVLSVENSELTKINVLPLKPPGVGQNIATHASLTARNFFFVLKSPFPALSPSFFPNPLHTF